MRQFLHNGGQLLFRRQTNILSAAVVIMFTFGLSHLVGLLKTRLLISFFFGSQASNLDVFYASFIIPDTIFQLLVIGSLSAAFIPVFSRHLFRDEKTAWRLANSSLNLVLSVFAIICAVIFILADPLSKLIAPGFTPSQIQLLSQLLKINLLSQLFFCISGFLTAMLQSHQRFIVPALAPTIYNLGIILGTIFLTPYLGIYGPALGAFFGAVGHMLIQLPPVIRLGFRPRFDFNFRQPAVAEIVRLMPPRALALGIDQLEQLVGVVLATTLAAGSLSIFNVSRLLYAIPSSIFGVTIGQAALPTLARQSTENKKLFSKTILESIFQIAYLALPISILFIVLRVPIVRLVFGSRTFPWEATLLTGKTLGILAFSATFTALQQLTNRGFYALHDTRTPLKIGFVAALFDSILAFIAVRSFNLGIIGLAMVLSLTAILESITSFLFLFRRLSFDASSSRAFVLQVLIPFSKLTTTAVITGLSLWLPMRLLDRFVFDTTRTLPLLTLTILTSVIGLSVYAFFSYLFKVDELGVFIKLAKKAKNWRQFINPPQTSEPMMVNSPDQV